jgi:hypothetical protein
MIFDRFRLDGQTALVTGGTRGIGLVIDGGYIAIERHYISAQSAHLSHTPAATPCS